MSCIRKIYEGIGASCTPLAGGVNDKLILVNYDDIVSVTYSLDMPLNNVNSRKYITAVARATGTKGYLVEGLAGTTIIARKNASRGDIFPDYTQEIEFVALTENGSVEALIETLAKSKVVAFYESNNEYHVLGINSGLVLSSTASDTSNASERGAYRVVLQGTKEGEHGKRLGIFTGTAPNFVYDKIATKAIFDGLLSVAP